MSNFKIINSLNDINLPSEWVDSRKFESKDRLVDHEGRKYRLIAKKELSYSCVERIGRGFLGTLAVCSTLSLAFFFSRTVRELFTKSGAAIRFGILEESPLAVSPKVKDLIEGHVNQEQLKNLGWQLFEQVRALGAPEEEQWALISQLEKDFDAEKLQPLKSWMDYRSRYADASDRVFNPLADFEQQIMRVESGYGDIPLDLLFSALQAAADWAKLIESSSQISNPLLQKDISQLIKRDLKYLAHILEENFDDLIKQIPGAIKRAQNEHAAAREEWERLQKCTDPRTLYSAALRLDEAAAYLDQLPTQGEAAEKMKAIGEALKGAAPQVAAVILDRGKRLGGLFPNRSASCRPVDLQKRLDLCAGVEEALLKIIKDKPELREVRFFQYLLSDPALTQDYPKALNAALSFLAQNEVDPRLLRASYFDEWTSEKKLDVKEDEKVSKVARFFLGLFALGGIHSLHWMWKQGEYLAKLKPQTVSTLGRQTGLTPEEAIQVDEDVEVLRTMLNHPELLAKKGGMLERTVKKVAEKAGTENYTKFLPIVERFAGQGPLDNATVAEELASFRIDQIYEINQLPRSVRFAKAPSAAAPVKEKPPLLAWGDIPKDISENQLAQLQSFLQMPATKEIDPRLFQHVLLDYSGAGTGYESYESIPMLEYKLQLVENWVNSLEANPLCTPSEKKMHETFKALRDSVKTAVYFTQKLEGPLDAFHAAIQSQVAGMKEGESFFFQAGWQVKDLGHAIVLEAVKEGETYTVRLYNRGQGVKKHAQGVTDAKQAYLSFIEIEKVEKDALTSPVFLGLLAALNRGEFKDEGTTEMLYDKILPILGGIRSEKTYSADYLQELLQVGHCTWLSLTAFDHRFLGNPDLEQRWSLLTKLYALRQMYHSKRALISEDKEIRELLRMGSSQVSKDISAMPLELFSTSERIYISELQTALQADLVRGDAEHLERARLKRPIANMNFPLDLLGKNTILDRSGEPKGWGVRSRRGDAGDPNLQLMSQVRNFVPTPSTVAPYLKELLDKGAPKVKTIEAMAAVKPLFTEAIRRLPLDREFWGKISSKDASSLVEWLRGKISSDDASSLLESLRGISHHFLYSVMAAGQGAKIAQPISSSDMMVLLKIFTLANMAIQQLPEGEKVDLDHLLAPSYRHFLLSEMPHAELIDSRWQEQFPLLKEYWLDRPQEKDYTGPSFFLTEGFVPGGEKQTIEYAQLKIHDKMSWEPQHSHFERGDKLGIEWQALNWLENWVEQNKEKTAMLPQYLEPRAKAILLLADKATKWSTFQLYHLYRYRLPKGFRILFDLSKDLAMLTAGIAIPADKLPTAKMDLEVREHDDLSPARYQITYNTNFWGSGPKVIEASDHLSERLLGRPLSEALETLYRSDKSTYRSGKLRRRMPPTERVLYRKDVAELELSNELARRIEACSSIKDLQITETLGFFSDRRHLLDDPYYRSLFAKLLLEPGLLQKRLSVGQAEAAATLKNLSTLFEEYFHLKVALGQLDVAGDLLELNDQISKIIGQQLSPHARHEWRKLLSGKLPDAERGRFAADLALSYEGSETLDAQGVEDILSGMLWFDKHPLANDHPLWSFSKDLRLRELPRHLAGLLTQAIPYQDDRILSKAIQRVIPDFKTRSFRRTDKDYIFRDEGGDVEVNLLTGHIWFSDGRPRALPKALATHFVLSAFKPSVETLDWREGVPGQFRAQTSEGEITIFADDRQSVEEIQWKTRGSTYRYTKWDKTGKLPGFLIEAGLLWTEIRPLSQDINTLITPFDRLNPLYRMEANSKIDQIFLLDSAGNDTGLILGKNLDLFANLDDPEYIATWIDEKTKLPSKVMLPRLGLEFNMETIKGQRRAYCLQSPGWYVPVDTEDSREQFIPDLGDLSNYIVLHKDLPDGTVEREVLIPEQSLSQGRPLAPKLLPLWRRTLRASTPVHRYALEQGRLKPKEVAAFRHLAAIYWRQREYEKAIACIQAYGSEMGNLDLQQKKLISELTHMPLTASDLSPPSRAAAMEAHYLLVRDAWDFGSKDEIDDARLLTDYLSYLQVVDQTGIYGLAPDKERLIIRHLDTVGLPEKEKKQDKARINLRRSRVFHEQVQEQAAPALTSGTVKTPTDLLEKGVDVWVQRYSQDLANQKYEPLPETFEGPYLSWVSVKKHFLALYELAKRQTPEDMAKLVKYLTGLTLSGDKHQHAIEALKAHARYQYEDPPPLSALLILVLRNPHAFPSATTLKDSFSKDWHNLFSSEKKLFEQYFHQNELNTYVYVYLKKLFSLKDFPVAKAEKKEHSKEPTFRRPAPARQDARFQLCSKLKPEVLDLGQTILTDFHSVVSVRPMTEREKGARSQALDELEEVLSKAFASVSAEIGKFRSALQDENVFTLLPEAQERLKKWDHALVDKATALGQELAQAQKNVVELANKPPKDPALLARYRQEIEGKNLSPLDFDTLTSFLTTRDVEELHRKAPYLSVEEIHQVFDATVEALKIGRLERFVVYQHQIISQLQAALQRNEPEVEISRIAKLLDAAYRYHPSYLSDQHPEYLVYDYFMSKNHAHFRLRADQVAVLEKMPERQFHAHTDHLTGVLLEAIMGFGKGDVVSVLQAVQEADGDKLVTISMPEALLPSMSARLQKLLGNSFRRIVELVKFNRESDVGAPALRHLLSRLQDIREGRRVMLISSSSALSIVLRFVEMALQKEGISDEQLELMSEIVSLLRKSGIANLDEVDLLLDILQAHLFTLGDHKRVHPDMETAALSLFEAIATTPELSNLIRWPFTPNGSPLPFSEQNYLDHAKEPLIEALLSGKIGSNDKELQHFLSSLSTDETNLLRQYLRASPQKPEELLALFRRLDRAERQALAAYIVEGTGNLPALNDSEKKTVEEYKVGALDPAYTFVKGISQARIKNLLATYKEQISKLFPQVMTKILGENYGPLPKEWRSDQKGMDFVAIPYHGSGKPARHTLHGTVLEIVDYTMMMHLAQPISREIIDLEITRLKAILEQEMEKGIDAIEESDALIGFAKLGGQGNLGGPITEEQKDQMCRHVNQHPLLKIELVQRYVLPQVKRYPEQLGLAAQMIAYLFSSVKAYSGTLWNLATFPHLFHKLIPSDTQPKTLDLLWRKSPHQIERIPERLQSAPLEERIAFIYGGKFQGSLADLQGTFRNEANINVARAIINLPQFEDSRYEAIMFHDERGQEMVLRKGEDKPEPLAAAGIGRDHVLGYWAQKYCTGVDWKLHPLEEGKVTIGRQTLMRDTLQAVWRLRDLAEGQNVRFIVPEEDFRIIAGELKRVFAIDVGDQLLLEHLFIYGIYLEKERLRADTPRALKEALKAHLIDKIFGVIKGAKAQDLRSLFRLTADLFVTSDPDAPWDQMGSNPMEAPKEIVIAENLQKLFSSKAFKAFMTHPLLARYSTEKLKEQLREVADSYMDNLSDTLTKGLQDNTRNEVEIESQKELSVDHDIKKETKKQMHLQLQSETFTEPRPVLRLPTEALLQSKTWEPIPPCPARLINQVVRVNDVIDQPLFSENLTIDLNLAPLYQRASEKVPPYAPWNPYQDIATNAVIIANGLNLQLALVSQDTAIQIQEELDDAAPGSVRLALYNLDSGLVKQGKNPIDIEAFMTLVVQAKFFDGRTKYTAQEKPYLKKWLQSTGRMKELQEFFERKILLNKDDAAKRFSGSTIEKIFKEPI